MLRLSHAKPHYLRNVVPFVRQFLDKNE